jgi:hypothetical protein
MTEPARIPARSPPLAAELLGRRLTVVYDPIVGHRGGDAPLATVTGVLRSVGYLGRDAFLRLGMDAGGEVLVRSWCVVRVEIGA